MGDAEGPYAPKGKVPSYVLGGESPGTVEAGGLGAAAGDPCFEATGCCPSWCPVVAASGDAIFDIFKDREEEFPPWPLPAYRYYGWTTVLAWRLQKGPRSAPRKWRD